MQPLHENQNKIMEYLQTRSEGATLDELAAHLEITRTAAKEHIIKLETLGYLSFIDTRGKVGRPRRRYLLSPQGQETFPRQYSWLSNELLRHLAETMGPAGVSRVMTGLAEAVAGQMKARFGRAGSSAELLNEVVAALNELGYRASLRQTDIRKGAVLEATNCVYHSVAKQHPELCQFDVRFLENATRMNVKLESCIAKGASVCRFCVTASKK